MITGLLHSILASIQFKRIKSEILPGYLKL